MDRSRTIAGEQEQVSPGDLVAVLLLDRPKQTTGLVERDVVGPGVKGSETLLSAAVGLRVNGRSERTILVILPATTATILNTVGTSAVPGHTDEQAAVVTKVGRPVVLAVGLETWYVRVFSIP